MNVTIAGGHGQIALHLTRMLTTRGDGVRSLIRNPAHADDVRAAGGEPVICDMEAADDFDVAAAVGVVDAVVFAAGAGPGSGPERKWTVDYGAAIKLIDAAKTNEIDRYVMVSAMGADPEAPGDDVFAVYLRAKGRADADLVSSGLAYTIVRPGRLTDEPGTGRVLLGEETPRGEVPREDVAAVLAAVLHEPGTAGWTCDLISGEIPVDEAVDALAET
jgi:uncharacterized protein YbjT (DUF2867 family)